MVVQFDFGLMLIIKVFERTVQMLCASGQSFLANWSLDAPQTGQTQSSGSFSNGVPGFTPCSESPVAGSYT